MLTIIFSAIIVTVLSHDNHYHYYNDPPPPSQDECKSVNATEPKQCPQTIGPPC